jgi:hypothetical protein
VTARAWIIAAVLAGPLTFAASADAGLPANDVVSVTPTTTIDVRFPLASTIDPISEDHVYIIQDIPTHQVLVDHVDPTGVFTPEDPIDLPTDVTPSALWWDFDGILHIETRELRSFTYCPHCDKLTEIPSRSSQITFIGDGAAGFNTDVLTDYGDVNSGSIWYGPNLDQQLVIPSIHPQEIDFSAYGEVNKNVIASGFYVVPSVSSEVLELSDSEPPAVMDTYAGPAGATQLAGIGISPLDLDPSAKANRPMFVSVPSEGGIDTGNVYATKWTKLEAGAGWQPISSTPIGSPTGITATCNWLGVNDYARDWFKLFRLGPPAGATCDATIAMVIKETKKRQLTVTAVITPYMDGTGNATASFSLPSHKGGKSTVRAKAKVDLTAGRVGNVNLKFTKAATAAVNDAVQSVSRLKGAATVKVTDEGGHSVKVTQPLTLKVSDAGKLVAKAG